MKINKLSHFNIENTGLEYGDDAYCYTDRYSQVCYKNLITKSDHADVPMLGVYTRYNAGHMFSFVGAISFSYLFNGNANLVDSVLKSISETGTPDTYEIYLFNSKLTFFNARIIIHNRLTPAKSGDVYPCIDIWNSYDGSRKAELSFGIAVANNTLRGYNVLSLRQNLGSYQQIHVRGSKVKLNNVIGGYIDNISNNITQFIEANCSKVVTMEAVVHTLELVKEIGKKKHDAIQVYISELVSQNRPITSWDMFLAISRYTMHEKNINAKILLENIIESFVIIPSGMADHLAIK